MHDEAIEPSKRDGGNKLQKAVKTCRDSRVLSLPHHFQRLISAHFKAFFYSKSIRNINLNRCDHIYAIISIWGIGGVTRLCLVDVKLVATTFARDE
jgi:hypothetical protein